MKAEDLVTRQFQEAKVAWKAERHALVVEIESLKLRLVGQAFGNVQSKVAAEEKAKPRTLEPGLKKAKEKGDPEEKAAAEDRNEKAREKAAAKKKKK